MIGITAFPATPHAASATTAPTHPRSDAAFDSIHYKSSRVGYLDDVFIKHRIPGILATSDCTKLTSVSCDAAWRRT